MSSSLAARVAVMQATNTGQRDDIGVYISRFNVATIGAVFVDRVSLAITRIP